MATLEGHSKRIKSVAVFPDGQRVVSGSKDNTLKVWNVATGICVATLGGHSTSVKSVAVFPDGLRVVSASSDKTLKVWDVSTGECVATLKGHSNFVFSVAVFPDGRRVVSASWDNTLKVWDVETGECVATLEGHSDNVRCGVRCTFVMIWLRRRSMALLSLRTGGASSLGRPTTRSRSGTSRLANAWRRWKGTRRECIAASAVLL